jgi:hypothetical protein
MAASSSGLWQCGTCTYADNKRAAVECEMCGVALRMSGAAVSGKRPASPVLRASAAVASKPSKLSRKVAVAKKPPPQDQHPPMHPPGVVLDIVGTNRGDRGRSCEEHLDACGTAVLMDDAVIRIRKEQILVEDFKAGKGKMKEETALTVNWVSDGIDRCRVGFLPRAYVPHAKLWDGVLCQVVFVGSADDPSSLVRRKCHHYCGYARVAVISALPGGAKVFEDKYDAMMD